MKKSLVSLYHGSFTGGSKNTSRFLDYLSFNNFCVEAFFFDIPAYFESAKTNVSMHFTAQKKCNSEVINADRLQDTLMEEMLISYLKDKNDYILFSEYLFPYCNILLNVKSKISNRNTRCAPLIIHPVGSDIWELGPQFKSTVKHILDSSLVNGIFAYSNSFANEIKSYYEIQREIAILNPVIDSAIFCPIDKIEKKRRKLMIGVDEDDFIIHHHSSMKKIKCPEVVLTICRTVTKLYKRNCVLIMTGPIPFSILESERINLTRLPESPYFEYKSQVEKLTILWTGLSANVEFLIQLADVELNASLHDSFNISLVEAMSCGVPVVTSDVVGIREHIVSSGSGICFPTKRLNYDELNSALHANDPTEKYFDIGFAVDALGSLIENKSGDMGQKGAAYTSQNFNFEIAYKQFNELINGEFFT